MKRVLFFVMALATMAITSQTQAQVKYGVKAGLNLSTITEENWTMTPGFHAGAYAQIKLMPMLSIQPEVMYSMQGANLTTTNSLLGQSLDTKTTLTSQNVIVPIMIQLTPIKMLTIEAGPQLGFNLGMSSHTVVTTEGVVNTENETDYTFESDEYNMFDFGVAAGLRLNLSNNLNVYARYVVGMTGIFVDNDETKNQNLMFGVGFSL